jgi:sulfoacetaldehyde dehydrogenase
VTELAGFKIPPDKTFLIVREHKIGKQHLFSTEKLGTVLAVFKYSGGFDGALEMVRQIYEVGGRGHSCGIYSFNDENIHRLALLAPVSRMMVRQPQSKSNAGTFTNGMPMTSSMGCGIWGGNITNENISLKHYLNVTWVSRPIPEDRPSEQELYGEFYNSEIFETPNWLARDVNRGSRLSASNRGSTLSEISSKQRSWNAFWSHLKPSSLSSRAKWTDASSKGET